MRDGEMINYETSRETEESTGCWCTLLARVRDENSRD